MRRFDLDDTSPGGGEARSLGSLFRELSADASVLIRQEVALARVEMRRNVRALARDVGSMAVWGVVATVGGLVLVAFLVAGLGDLLDNYWLAALVVGLVFVAAGAFMALRALRSLQSAQVRPEATVESLRETGAWAQGEAAELRAALTGGDGRPANGDGRAATAAPPTVNRIAALHAAEAEAPSSGGPAAGAKPGTGARSGAPRQVLVRAVWSEFGADDISGQAAKVAYYFFLSLPPGGG
ncbi:MAG TPA: phage holin family protein, partial [Longimicrobiaceae bacterium]|nr:phage holin family protein [Longimicrobiaceae bacterium]